ncbi:acetyl-CoA synthetase-like protein, partial [Periconia macrospinosa]
MFGFLRAGVKAFFISPRNSSSATSHLLQKTGSQSLLVSSDEAMQQLANTAITQDKLEVTIRPMPTYEQLFNASEKVAFPLLKAYDFDSVALILHSSGSTNFPKPIPLTYRNLAEWGRGSYGERNFEGEVLGGHSLAFFHAMGVISPLWCAYSGMQLAVFAPASPPIRPTPENIYKDVVASSSTYIFCVPSHIERWAAMPETYNYLSKNIKALAYCGAPLGADAGNLLSSKGVNLQPYFASTETGGMSLFLPERRSEPRNREWARFRIAPHCNVRVVPRSDDSTDEELSELVFLQGQNHTPSVFNTEFDGEQAYTTGDLVVSSIHDDIVYFQFYGREDDQILLSTGEKTNPVPIEKILLKDNNIDFVVLFGDGKQQNGALIQPSASYLAVMEAAGLRTPNEKLIHFRQTIAPSLAVANEFAPAHSFIFPELVLIADSPFQLTGKGTVRRRHTLKEYSDQIEKAYTEVERSTLPELLGPTSWTINNTLDFVTDVVKTIIGHTVPPNEDIFQHGADSLSATWIRNTLLRILREAGFKTREIPADFVFQFPSIYQLAAFLFGLSFNASIASTSHSSSSHSGVEEEVEDIEEQAVVWPDLGRNGETIVKLRPGSNPLIIIHGTGGTIHAFPPLQEKFNSGLWAIQVTPETPLDKMENLVSFYHAAIKREQPEGPYRLSAFSATSIVAVALAKKFESEGDVVAQVALLDHVPGFYACSVYGIEANILSDSSQLHEFNRVCCEGICDLLRRDGGGRIARRHQLAQELSDAFAGKHDVPEFSLTYWRTVEHFLKLMLEFMLREDFEGVETAAADAPPMRAYLEWEKSLKAPVSVYIAEDGMKKTIPESYMEEWGDLGCAKSWPTARIYQIPGGHFDILGNNRLVDLLQNEW